MTLALLITAAASCGTIIYLLALKGFAAAHKPACGRLRSLRLLSTSPRDPGYQKYLKSVVTKLPAGDIRVIHADGVDFVAGSVAWLAWIFPKAAAGLSDKQCVSGVPVKASGVYNREQSARRPAP